MFIVPDDLDAAFAILHLKQPQFAAFLLNMPVPIYIDESMGEGTTMYTNGARIVVGRWWLDNNDTMSAAAGLSHETLHVMYNHPGLLKMWHGKGMVDDMPFINQIAQFAFDYQVNDTLYRCGFDIPEGWLHNTSYGTWLDDEVTIYRRLYDQYKDYIRDGITPNKLNFSAEMLGPDVLEAGDTEIDDNRKAAIVRKAFADLDTSKMRGVRPGDLERLIDRLIPTNVDWRAVVRPRIRTVCGADRHTWNTLNRAAFAMRTTLPGKYGHRTGKICLAADTSGSISLGEQSLYTAALGEIFATCMPKELWFLEIDTYVRRARRILTAPELAAVTCTNGGFHGGGGTNMPAIWEWLEEQKIVPDLLLVLTDMHTPWPEKLAPVKDVVWVSTNKMGLIAPIGRTVPMGKR